MLCSMEISMWLKLMMLISLQLWDLQELEDSLQMKTADNQYKNNRFKLIIWTVVGYVQTAPLSFLSVFVDGKTVRSHCSVFKWKRYENDRRSQCSCKTVLLLPFSKQCLLLLAVKKAPNASLNAIVMSSLSAKECEAFSNVSVFGAHTENGSFSKRIVFKFMRFR